MYTKYGLILLESESTLKKQTVSVSNLRHIDPPMLLIATKELGDNTHGAQLAFQKQENECGSCYGARAVREDGCCNTCEDVRQAYANMGWGMANPDDIEQCVREGWREKIEKQSNEGCNIHGQIAVNKVRGNFHIAPGQSFQQANMHVHDLKEYTEGASDGHAFDMSHTIHYLKFGPDPLTGKKVNEHPALSAVTNALAGTEKMTDNSKYHRPLI